MRSSRLNGTPNTNFGFDVLDTKVRHLHSSRQPAAVVSLVEVRNHIATKVAVHPGVGSACTT